MLRYMPMLFQCVIPISTQFSWELWSWVLITCQVRLVYTILLRWQGLVCVWRYTAFPSIKGSRSRSGVTHVTWSQCSEGMVFQIVTLGLVELQLLCVVVNHCTVLQWAPCIGEWGSTQWHDHQKWRFAMYRQQQPHSSGSAVVSGNCLDVCTVCHG